jgi:hypothetical protein
MPAGMRPRGRGWQPAGKLAFNMPRAFAHPVAILSWNSISGTLIEVSMGNPDGEADGKALVARSFGDPSR